VEILFLGGTNFLGRHAAGIAIERGHDVTLFHRGSGSEDPFPAAKHLHGDRDGGLEVLKGRTWDAVVDTSGYVPRVVRASAETLSAAVDHYTFVSTCSVYSELGSGRVAEDGKLHEPPADSEDVMEHYGALKVGCERVVEERFAGRSFIPRPGLIVGPYDPTDRFTYWVRRIADGGRVLAPGSPDAEVELIDARDLAAWMIEMAERRATRIYNAVGPDRVLTMGELLETSRQATGSDAELVWVDEEFLLAEGVQPWTELPVWLPSSDPDAGGFSTFDASKAIGAGLTFRPLIETVRDTLAWHRDVMNGEPARDGAISTEREAELLSAWKR
jgi:nucleoside-diphosphate-sugar epimerase